MPHPSYTDAEVDFLARRIALGDSVKAMTEAYRIAFPESSRGDAAIERARSAQPRIVARVDELKKQMASVIMESEEHDEGITRTSPTKPGMLSPEAEWARAEQISEAEAEWFAKRHYFSLKMMTRKPIAVAFISDQHLTMRGPTRVKRMRADAYLIRMKATAIGSVIRLRPASLSVEIP